MSKITAEQRRIHRENIQTFLDEDGSSIYDLLEQLRTVILEHSILDEVFPRLSADAIVEWREEWSKAIGAVFAEVVQEAIVELESSGRARVLKGYDAHIAATRAGQGRP